MQVERFIIGFGKRRRKEWKRMEEVIRELFSYFECWKLGNSHFILGGGLSLLLLLLISNFLITN